MEAGSATRCGTHTRVNQDFAYATVVSGSAGSSVAVAAVFDGHGALGERASGTARAELASLTAADSLSLDAWLSDPLTALTELTSALNEAVVRAHTKALPQRYEHCLGKLVATYELSADGTQYNITESGRSRSEPVDFGCTAAIAVVLRQQGISPRVLVANLGDSPVVLCTADSGDDEGEIHAATLSVAHTAAEEAERTRIRRACGANVRFGDGYLQPTAGPLRGRCLQPTRGLGHPVFCEYGFSAVPHVSLTTLDGALGGAFAVAVLSDGVSDLLSAAAIAELVAERAGEPGPAAHAARALVDEAAMLADLSTAGTDRDDASAAVIFWEDE